MNIQNIIRSVIGLFIAVGIGYSANAQQQPQWTQFNFNPIVYNPAMSGANGDMLDATAMLRWQWVGFEGVPETKNFSVSSRPWGSNVGLGLMFGQDNVAVFKWSHLQGNYAYHIDASFGTISLGLSGLLTNFRANYTDAETIEQDRNFDTNVSDWKTNFGTGLMLTGNNYYVGASLPSILSTEFGGEATGTLTARQHYYFMGGYQFQVAPNVQLEPNVLVRMVNGSPLTYDINALARFQQRIAAGLAFRKSESLALLLQLGITEQLLFGYSYDYVFDDEIRQIGTSSHEVMLKFRIKGLEREKKEEVVAPVDKPVEVADFDLDGVEDASDKCPDVAGPASNGGCPLDSDGDGVVDSRDKCPNAAGSEETGGCPDSDGDGVMDSEDDCSGTAGIASANGCPDQDGDGTPDDEDKCPGLEGGAPIAGCPQTQYYEAQLPEYDKIELSFELNKSKLPIEVTKQLDEVAGYLKNNGYLKVKITGYTDKTGPESYNLKLSQERADAAKNYLVKQGVSADRVTSQGLGEQDPIGNNSDTKERAINRRVEFEFDY